MKMKVLLAAASLSLAGHCPGTSLAEVSPFLPCGPGTKPDGAAASAGLELRGIMSTAEGVKYCIYDLSQKRSVWAGLAEQGLGFVIVSADSARETVTLRLAGEELTLAMRVSKIVASNPPPLSENPALADSARPGRITREFNPAAWTALPPDTKARLINADQAEEARLRAMKEKINLRRLRLSQGSNDSLPGDAP